MKKFIALTIGLSLLGAALIVPMSNASREAYHSYISQKSKTDGSFRRSTLRQGNRKQFLYPRRNVVRREVAKKLRKNYLIPRIGKRNIYRTKDANKNLKLRTSTRRIMRVNSAKNSHKMAISAQALDSNSLEFNNYSNELFTLEIPVKSLVSDSNNVLEISIPFSSTKISAKKLSNKCTGPLSICGRAISRSLDYKSDIYRTSQTALQYQKTDIVLGESGLDSKKFVEGFIAIKEGKSSFIARFVVEGRDGDLFLVEVTSNLKDMNKSISYARRAFETFRAIY